MAYRWYRTLAPAMLASLLACSSSLPSDRGSFSGRLQLVWQQPDEFLYAPDSDDPLRFARPGGEVIEPGPMVTDGGSIPRPFWAFRYYSPWGYAPAFIVHDWLFVQHHCGTGAARTLEEAAEIMVEGIMTLIRTSGGPGPAERLAVASMIEAVRSPAAKRLWESGACPSGARVAEALDRLRAAAATKSSGDQATFSLTIDFAAPCGRVGGTAINPSCPATRDGEPSGR